MNKHFIFLLILILSIGCNKNESPYGSTGINIININPELKSQAFKSGSYWIYKNDSTSKIDCTLIYQDFTDFEAVFAGHGFTDQYECFEMFYNEYYSNNFYSSYWDRMMDDCIFRNPINYFNHQVFGGLIVYCQDTAQGQIYYDSLRVGSNIFYHVQRLPIDRTLLYSAKSVGVIRKVIIDSVEQGTWNLLRWKIVK
jgi:hypothetical protein